MNRTFKVVGRYLPSKDQKVWCRGKPDTQAKKTVYTSKKDFETYSPNLIRRWKELYQVEVYELVNDKWIKIED